MECKLQENTLKDTIYSVGIDQTLNLKEQIADVHGADSEVMKAVKQLDEFLSRPDPTQYVAARKLRDKAAILSQSADKKEQTKAKRMLERSCKLLSFENRPEVRGFTGSVNRRIRNWSMSKEVALAVINEGYIEVLRRLAYWQAQKQVDWAKQCAQEKGMSLPAALLFGRGGAAFHTLIDWIVKQKAHGMHRPGRSPNRWWRQQTQQVWRDAGRCCSWPYVENDSGERIPYDAADDESHLPEGAVRRFQQWWRCNSALRDYAGTNRLSGDLAFKIIEDVFDMMMRNGLSSLTRDQKFRYDRIVEEANKKGINSFLAVYKNLFADSDALRPCWDKARRWLYDYSMLLWQTQSEEWLAEGKRQPASGVVFKPSRAKPCQQKKNKPPGTIYLNNGRYYWIVANKMKPRPLIDPKSRPEVPGSFLCDNGRYYWHVPRWVKRKRLVPEGEKFSTKDKAVAIRIAKKLWNQIKKNNPKLAANIMKHTRVNGMATKDRAVAEKVRAKMWKDIQKNAPELAAKMKGNRPKAKDCWHALIRTEGKLKFIGSYKTRSEAEAAFAREFEKIWGYPPGYNVQCIPKIDKVWPTWAEEKKRLEKMSEQPRMPVICFSDKAETLEPMIKQMQKIDWLVENCMLVLDKNSPSASQDVAVQSRGEKWYTEIKRQGKRAVICGSASIDKNTGRIKITIYDQGFNESRVLTEEVYHIIFEIIRQASPKTFASIKKWYLNRLENGLDPTWLIHEAFAELMVQETQLPGSTDLPRNVVNYAQRVFSDRNIVPKWVMKKVMAGA